MRELERLFKGLADHTRLRVINLLLHGELCVCDIQHVLGSPQPNVSRHLAYLKHSGLVFDRRERQRMYSRLAAQGEPARRRLLASLQAAFAGSDEFERDSRKLDKAIARGACTVAAGILPTNPRSYRTRQTAGQTPAPPARPPTQTK